MAALFDSLTVRGIRLRNRIGVSPMCQYSACGGQVGDWHLVHLGSRAMGGAGLVMVEGTAISENGRLSTADTGIWSDDHVAGLTRLASFIREQGAVAGIQLAHAGRKAGSNAKLGFSCDLLAPSAISYLKRGAIPRQMTLQDIAAIRMAFRSAADRALRAGFEWLEIHAAHGYLLHTFLSSLSNQRNDEYGADFDGRTRLLREVVVSVREIWPERLPLAVRISATDWIEKGWDPQQSVRLGAQLKVLGVDLIDCSSGGIVPGSAGKEGPGFQVPFAEKVRTEAEIMTAAVGLIVDPRHANEIVSLGKADLVLLGRELLRDPYWPLRAMQVLGSQREELVPGQYRSAFVADRAPLTSVLARWLLQGRISRYIRS